MVVGVDLYSLSENNRIRFIGKSVMNAPKGSDAKPPMNGFIVETEAKADRYIEKLERWFPGIRVIDRVVGPVPGTILVRVGPPLR